MEQYEKEAIRENLDKLTDDIHMKILYPVLEKKRIFTKTMLEYIEHAGPRHAQAQKMLQDIRCRGPGTFDNFVWCLDNTEQSHLADLLRESRDRLKAAVGHAAVAGHRQHSPFATGVSARSFPVPETSTGAQPIRALPDAVPDEDCYSIKPTARGVGFIINNKVFSSNHEERLGSEKDVTNLKHLFTQLEFQYYEAENLTKEELLSKLEHWSKMNELKEASSCVIALMSHGEEGHLFSSDGQKIPIKDLVSYFNGHRCPDMSGKPKMFVIQACRGKEMDAGAGENRPDGPSRPISQVDVGQNLADCNAMKKIPAEADIVLAYSTTPGFVSWRNSQYGSWYIDAFCKVFKDKAAKEHVLDLLVKVNNEVSTHFHEEQNMQMPQPAVALRRKWFMYGQPH